MAIYHLHVQTIGRGSGKSAVAAAAYRSTSRLTDNETGIICDYSRKAKAFDRGILAPKDAPKWVYDREKLWNSVQEKENRKNSQFAWEYDIALPHEAKNRALIYHFCQQNFVAKGLICDYAVHKPDKRGDERNWHAHIMVTTREMTAEGWGEKYRRGENKMSDRREWLNEVRKSWEVICNEELEIKGSKERVDCRTLEAQGIDRVPQRHQGPTATAMERKGKKPDRTRVPKEDEDRVANEKKSEAQEQLAKIDFEEKFLKEKIRLANLSEDDFKKERKALEYWQLKAQALAAKELLPEIEKANKIETGELIRQTQELNKHRPSGVYPKPNVFKNLLLSWIAEDGEKFSKYEDYAKHQEGLINAWGKKMEPLEEKERRLAAERKLIEETKKDGNDQRQEAVRRALSLSREQEKRPTLFEKIRAKAQEVLSKAAEFDGYRNYNSAFEEIGQARIETAQHREQDRRQMRGMRR